MTVRYLLWISLLLVGLQACRETITVDNSDKDFPLTLQVNANTQDESVDFSWEAAKSSGFEQFLLVRSTASIPTGISPLSSSVQILVNTTDPDSVSFKDASLPLLSELYYKLYAKVNDRFIESAEVKVPLNNFLLSGTPSIIRFFPDSNWVVLGCSDVESGSVFVIDYNLKKVVNKKGNVPFTSIEYMGVDIGYNDNKAELYWWGAGSKFLVYSLPSLDQTISVNNASTGFSLISNNQGRLFTTQYDYYNAFATRRRDNFTSIKSYERGNYYDHRTLLMLDPASNKMLEAGPYNLQLFTVDALTGQASNTITQTTSTYYTFIQTIPASPDRQFFIPQLDGKVYNQSLQTVAQVPVNNTGSAIDMAFSSDGAFLYVLSSSFFAFNTSVIEKFRFPSMELVDTRTIGNVAPQKIACTNDGLVFVGNFVNNTTQFTVKKINF